MRILFISENFPYPLDSGGRIRTFHILQGLSQEHEVTLITTVRNERQYQYILELNKVCRKVIAVPATSESWFGIGVKLARSLISPIPFPVARHYVPELATKIRGLLATGGFDVAHMDHLDAAVYLPHIPNSIITVLDEHNIVANQIKTSLAVESNLLRKFYLRLQWHKTLRYEASVCSRLSRCLVCSDIDKATLLRLAATARVITIPNGVDLDYFGALPDSQPRADKEDSIIFVGMLDYRPGTVAVHYFCERILPLLRVKFPRIRFYIVGNNPPKSLYKLARDNLNIVLTGWVPDVRPHVHRCKVFVVPLKSGSGTRLKILEAMAMGIPVVSTSLGAEGLRVTSWENIIIADTPEDFSAAVEMLLTNASLALRIRDNAARLVRDYYGWPSIWKDLLDTYRQLPMPAVLEKPSAQTGAYLPIHSDS